MSGKLEEGWINYLRSSSRPDKDKDKDKAAAANPGTVRCPQCDAEIAADLDQFRVHVLSNAFNHGSLENDTDIEHAFRKLTLNSSTCSQTGVPSYHDHPQRRSAKKRPVSGTSGHKDPDLARADADEGEAAQPKSKKIYSPPPSDVQQQRASPPPTSSPHGRSRARPTPKEFDRGYNNPRGNRSARQLFNPDSDEAPTTKSQLGKNTQGHSGRCRQQHSPNHSQPQPQIQGQAPPQSAAPAADAEPFRIQVDPDRPHTSLVPQPKTKPISHEQLVAEVKGIYTGLVMIEAKCIEVDTAQSSNTKHPLSSEQWQALIALHRTLLHEHHDFFLASQHPAASEALRRLAARYMMPARMWRHGIHSFLELLRHRLPASYDQMITFIYLAYGMVALLYETVPAFEDTWIECLGDLARYRMAIEDNDIKDRETWTTVARFWYSLASDKAPEIGRLYHHLAILARPNAVQQLYFYVKSLCVQNSFLSARESIMTLFDPRFESKPPKLPFLDAAFVKVHAIMFSKKHIDQLEQSMEEYLGNLDSHIGRSPVRWLESGYHTGIPLSCALLGYGTQTHFMMKLFAEDPDTDMENNAVSEGEPDEMFFTARSFMVKTYEIAVRRWGDPNTLPFLHTILAFMWSLSLEPRAIVHVQQDFPWKLTAVMLNYWTRLCDFKMRTDSKDFPGALENDVPRPLPEDFAMRGLVYTRDYYPEDWFKNCTLEEEEKYLELPSMTNQRQERIIWLGRRLAESGRWLTWDDEKRKFGVNPAYADSADDIPLDGDLPMVKHDSDMAIIKTEDQA